MNTEVVQLGDMNRETKQKSLRLEKDLIDQIEKLARKNERDFTKQVSYMLKKYIEITQEK